MKKILTWKEVAAEDTGGIKMYCHCGDCPKEIPRRETVVFICPTCADLKEGWMDVNLVLGKCDTCKRIAFCHAEKKKEAEWTL